jgi:ubiquinol-cytochrome c reductase cytochrome b subunit
MGAAVMILFFLPWLDRSPVKSIRYRGPIYKRALAIFVVSFVILGYLGVAKPTDVWGQIPRRSIIGDPRGRATWVARSLHDPLLPVLPADAVVHRARQGASRCPSG